MCFEIISKSDRRFQMFYRWRESKCKLDGKLFHSVTAKYSTTLSSHI